MKTIIFILFVATQILLLSFVTLGQKDVITIDLFSIDKNECYSSSVRPVYEILFRDKFYYKKKRYKIRLPDNKSEYGIAFIYYTGFNDNIIPRAIPVLIEDFKSDKPRFYLDTNNNLDFTDDGNPKRYEKDSLIRNGTSFRYVDFTIWNKEQSKNPYKFYLLEMTDTSSLNHLKNSVRTEKKEKLAEVEYWLSEIRFNKVAGEFLINDESFQIIIEDSYCNSRYGETGEFITIKCLSGKNSTQDQWKINQETLISLNHKNYSLKEIDPFGKSIILEEADCRSKTKFHRGDTIDNFHIKLINGEETYLKNYLYQDKYILLYFWGTWCAPCKQRLPLLKELYNKYNNRIEIIGLANDRKLSKVKNYIKKNEVEWINTSVKSTFN